MKLNPCFSPDEVGFHHGVISSHEVGFIPCDSTDLVEKQQSRILLCKIPIMFGFAEGVQVLVYLLKLKNHGEAVHIIRNELRNVINTKCWM